MVVDVESHGDAKSKSKLLVFFWQVILMAAICLLQVRLAGGVVTGGTAGWVFVAHAGPV
jgi:hypothetical protein